MSTAAFQTLKKGIFIVNTAKGGVLDKAALAQAIENGTGSSVGLDVYQQEPNRHSGLVASLHTDTATIEVSKYKSKRALRR